MRTMRINAAFKEVNATCITDTGRRGYFDRRKEEFVSIRPPRAAHEKYYTDGGSIIHAKAETCPKCGLRRLASKPSMAGAQGG
jgi:hypothetical protein